jgi:hypothetical protein
MMGDQGIIVAVNNDDKAADLYIRLPLQGKVYESLLDKNTCEVQGDTLHLLLQPNESQIIVMK